MNLGEIRSYIYDALDESSSTIAESRVDALISSASLWVLQAHDWPFLSLTIEDQSANDLISTDFRRVSQVFDTKTNYVISPVSIERALDFFNDVPLENPQVFTIKQYGVSVSGGVSIRFWPQPPDNTEERFTVTGILMPSAWPNSFSVQTDVPTLSTGGATVILPEVLHDVIAFRATSVLASQEQIRDVGEFYSNEAHYNLREAKNALMPPITTRIVLGADYYQKNWALRRRPWR